MTKDVIDMAVTVLISVGVAVLIVLAMSGCAEPSDDDSDTDADTETESDIDSDSWDDVDNEGCYKACQWPVDAYCLLDDGQPCLDEIRACRRLVGGGTIGSQGGQVSSKIPDLGCLRSTDGDLLITGTDQLTDVSAIYDIDAYIVVITENLAFSPCPVIAHYRAEHDDLSRVCIPEYFEPDQCDGILDGC
jgi:hypothetical protein